MADETESAGSGFDRGYEEHQRRQARLGLSMTPAERLQWLERKQAELRALLGRARQVRDSKGQ